MEIERRTGVWTHGVMLPYPFQANLHGLPFDVLRECLTGFVQAQIEAIARETQAFVYQTASDLETDLLNKLKAGGMEVNVADKAAFVKASASIYDEFGSEVTGGKDLVDAALGLAN